MPTTMLTNEARFVDFWASRIGEEAARLRWRAAVLLLRGYLLEFVWLPCVIVGGRTGVAALVVAGIAVAVVSAGCLVAASLLTRSATRAASRLLDMRLGFRHVAPPPRSRERYEEWCRLHGVTPYAAAPHLHPVPPGPRG
jgi:hypothetical protein